MSIYLTSEIEDLINSQREGTYWDFKDKHHDNKALLLHDILCLANAFHKGNKYLIYGVSDPSENCEIRGVSSENRRSQANLIDFIRSKPFAGDVRPEISLRTIQISGKELEILTIFDRPQKPYYLRESYRDRNKEIFANSIYTRNLDTNTPIDKSADLRVVELMWRERFGLDIAPSERMIHLLRRADEWHKDIGNIYTGYHRFHPEYQIEFCGVKEAVEAYSYFYPNESSATGVAKFKYLSTELFELPYMYCDERRLVLAVPKYSHVKNKGRAIYYLYYIRESRDGAFLEFLTDGKLDFSSRGMEAAFIVFQNQAEKEAFEQFLKLNLDKFNAMPESQWTRPILHPIEEIGEHNACRIEDMCKVLAFYRQWQVELHL